MKTFLKDCRAGRLLLLRGDMISQYLDLFGEWCESEVELFRYLLPKDGVCIEVGANIGAHTVPLSQACETGRVFAFEPQRPIFHILCGNLALNGRINVVARQQAAGDVAQRIVVETGDYETAWNYGAFSLDEGFSREAAFPDPVWREEIEVIRLDGDPELSRLERLDLIKIDAEGHEPRVLAGAQGLVTKFRPDLFVEANNQAVVEALFDTLRPLGYRAWWFISHRFRADNFNRSQIRLEGWDANLLFRHPSRGAEEPPLPVATGAADMAKGLRVLNRFPP